MTSKELDARAALSSLANDAKTVYVPKRRSVIFIFATPSAPVARFPRDSVPKYVRTENETALNASGTPVESVNLAKTKTAGMGISSSERRLANGFSNVVWSKNSKGLKRRRLRFLPLAPKCLLNGFLTDPPIP